MQRAHLHLNTLTFVQLYRAILKVVQIFNPVIAEIGMKLFVPSLLIQLPLVFKTNSRQILFKTKVCKILSTYKFSVKTADESAISYMVQKQLDNILHLNVLTIASNLNQILLIEFHQESISFL